MKVWKRTTLFAVLFALILALFGTLSAQADGFFYRYATPYPTGYCLFLFGFPVASISDYSIEYNLPEGASINTYSLQNGTATFESNTPVASGTGTLHFSGFFGGVPSFPFNGGTRYDTIIGGQAVYSSTLNVSCAGAGTDAVITVTNGAVSSGGGSAISDGRINPENYAPVALYCDGSVLNAYGIDAQGQGTLTWSYDFSASPAAALPNLLNIALSKTPDNRYSVLAPQSDGKQYLFVFDGCPSPGVTQTFVSDPVTGQFVSTQ